MSCKCYMLQGQDICFPANMPCMSYISFCCCCEDFISVHIRRDLNIYNPLYTMNTFLFEYSICTSTIYVTSHFPFCCPRKKSISSTKASNMSRCVRHVFRWLVHLTRWYQRVPGRTSGSWKCIDQVVELVECQVFLFKRLRKVGHVCYMFV